MPNQQQTLNTSNSQLREAVQEVVDYLWDDEYRHFRLAADDAIAGMDEAKLIVEGHIFRALVTLNSWLCGQPITAEMYLDDSFDAKSKGSPE